MLKGLFQYNKIMHLKPHPQAIPPKDEKNVVHLSHE